MRSASGHTLLALSLALCTAVCGCSAPSGEPAGDSDTARVVRVVDGDTIRVALPSGEERVRYIGIDTPESVKPGSPVECFAKRASAFNERLVAGERVRLVRRGYATVATFPPNVAHERDFRRLAERARLSGRGLWSKCVGMA